MSQDSKTLNDVVNQLDKILFDEYVKARSAALKAMIEQGVLSPAMDWYSAPKPTGKRSPGDGLKMRARKLIGSLDT